MKKNIKLNKQIIKALSIGISASMMLQPMAAFAAESEDANTNEEITKLQDATVVRLNSDADEKIDTAIEKVEEAKGYPEEEEESNESTEGTTEGSSEETSGETKPDSVPASHIIPIMPVWPVWPVWPNMPFANEAPSSEVISAVPTGEVANENAEGSESSEVVGVVTSDAVQNQEVSGVPASQVVDPIDSHLDNAEEALEDIDEEVESLDRLNATAQNIVDALDETISTISNNVTQINNDLADELKAATRDDDKTEATTDATVAGQDADSAWSKANDTYDSDAAAAAAKNDAQGLATDAQNKATDAQNKADEAAGTLANCKTLVESTATAVETAEGLLEAANTALDAAQEKYNAIIAAYFVKDENGNIVKTDEMPLTLEEGDADTALAEAKAALDAATAAAETAVQRLTDAQEAEASAKTLYDNAYTAYSNAQSEFETAAAKVQEAYAAWQAALENGSDDAQALQATLEQATAYYNAKKAAYDAVSEIIAGREELARDAVEAVETDIEKYNAWVNAYNEWVEAENKANAPFNWNYNRDKAEANRKAQIANTAKAQITPADEADIIALIKYEIGKDVEVSVVLNSETSTATATYTDEEGKTVTRNFEIKMDCDDSFTAGKQNHWFEINEVVVTVTPTPEDTYGWVNVYRDYYSGREVNLSDYTNDGYSETGRYSYYDTTYIYLAKRVKTGSHTEYKHYDRNWHEYWDRTPGRYGSKQVDDYTTYEVTLSLKSEWRKTGTTIVDKTVTTRPEFIQEDEFYYGAKDALQKKDLMDDAEDFKNKLDTRDQKKSDMDEKFAAYEEAQKLTEAATAWQTIANDKLARVQAAYDAVVAAIKELANIKNLSAVQLAANGSYETATENYNNAVSAYNEAKAVAEEAQTQATKAQEEADRAKAALDGAFRVVVPVVEEEQQPPVQEEQQQEEQQTPTTRTQTQNQNPENNEEDQEEEQQEEEQQEEEQQEEEQQEEQQQEEQRDIDDENTALAANIEDDDTPLAALPDAKEMSWWWLLIVLALGTTGAELYRRHMVKKAKNNK